MKKETLAKAAASAFVASGMLAASGAQAAPSWAKCAQVKTVKCYGVAKKGQNDCGSKNGSHGCAGQAPKDNDPNEWVYFPDADTCKKVGGTAVAKK